MVPRAVRTPDRSLLRQNAIFLDAADRAGLLDQLRDPAPGVPSEDGAGVVRLAIVDPTPEKLEFARKIVDRGRPWRGRRDVWFSADGLVSRGGKVAFLFPGIEGEIRADVADIAARYGWDTPASLHDQASPDDVEALARVSLELSLFCYSALCELGVAPNVVAGQSIGEWAGLVAAEVVPPEALDAFVATLDPQSFDFPDVVYAAIGTDVATVEAEIADLDRVEITHDNCPHQTIVCGPEGDVTVALDRLKARRVFGSLLPFRSGFHGSLIVPYLSPFEAAIARVPLQPGRIPIWSATSCEPYPEDPSGIRALELAHLSQRVRFRELVRRLFDDGVRCFVQVGAGSLPGFVEDTLRGEDFLQTSCIAAKHRGLEQLLRVASALWVEGASGIRLNELLPASAASGPAASAHPAVHRIQLGLPLVRIAPGAIPAPSRALPTGPLNGTTPPSAASPTSGRRDGDRLAGAFHSLLGDLEAAASEVLAAASAPAGMNQREAPRSIVRPLELSLDRFPCLYDHSLVHVPEDWPNDVDRFAVVPLTMALELMLEAAGELCPGLVAVGVEDVVATRWLEVAPPVTVQTVATLVQGRPGSAAPERPTQRVDVSIDGYCRCTAIFAPSYAAAPPRRAEPLQGVVSQMATPEEVYGTGELFHGPAYRGLLTLGPAGENGLDAVVTGSAAPGALLDNAGQVVGCWICFSASVNRVAFPVAIERIDFYGPKPLPGEHCTVKMRVVTCMANSIRVTAEFSTDEGLWAHIDGWEERRFESDQTIWSFVTDPTNHLLGEPREGGWMLASEHWRTAASRDLISRTVLTQSERADYHQRRGADQRQWLLGRIAAKDAVRRWCTLRGYRRLHPLEVQITNDPLGRPLAVTPFDIDLHISLAHTRWVAVALAGDRDVGIDIERVEARSESFLRATFEEAEQKVLLEGTGSPEEAATRFTTGWSAKEAVAKATGHGLGGRPKDFVISKVDGSRLWVNGVATDSAREGDWVIVWTTHDEPAEGVER